MQYQYDSTQRIIDKGFLNVYSFDKKYEFMELIDKIDLFDVANNIKSVISFIEEKKPDVVIIIEPDNNAAEAIDTAIAQHIDSETHTYRI